MLYLYTWEKQPSHVDSGSSGGGNTIIQNLTTEVFASLGATFDFIDSLIKDFDENYQAWSNIYIEAMQYFLNKIPVQLPKPLNHKEKRQ